MRIVLVCLSLLSLVYAQTTYTWVGGETCNTGNVWSYSSNATCWKPQHIPGSLDTLIFPTGTSTTVLGSQNYVNGNNFYAYYGPYGYVQKTQYNQIQVEGTLYINSSIVLVTTTSFTIAKGAAVQIQGLLGAIDGPGAIVVDGSLTLLQGMISGTGPTTINAGALFNLSCIQIGNEFEPYNVTEVYVLRDLDIYGNVSMTSYTIAHWGFWWESKFITINIHAGGYFNLGGFFSKFFEGNIYSFQIYPCANPIFPATIVINPNGVLNVQGYPGLYHPSIVNNGGTLSGYYYYTGLCSSYYPIVQFPYGANYTDTVTPSNSCSWDCRFPWACSAPDCYGQYTPPSTDYDLENLQFIYFMPPRYEVTRKPVLVAKSCEDIFSCRDSEHCHTLYIDLADFGTHLHCAESLEFTGKKIIFTNAEEIVVADDITVTDCSITADNVIIYFARELHSLGSTFNTLESGEIVFIYLPTSGSDVDAVSYPYYFTNQHFYWEDAFERITFTDTSLQGEMTFVSPARVYGSSGLRIQSGSNIFVEREFKSISFAGTGPIIIEREATLVLGIEVGVFGDSIVDVFGTLQVNSFSTVTSERLIRLHEGATLTIDGELTSTIDISECSIVKDFITSVSGQIVQC